MTQHKQFEAGRMDKRQKVNTSEPDLWGINMAFLFILKTTRFAENV
jgi:hypothetical protein